MVPGTRTESKPGSHKTRTEPEPFFTNFTGTRTETNPNNEGFFPSLVVGRISSARRLTRRANGVQVRDMYAAL